MAASLLSVIRPHLLHFMQQGAVLAAARRPASLVAVGCSWFSALGGGGLQAVHEEVQQAAGLGVLPGFTGHGEDADQAGGDVLGAGVGAKVADGAAGVEDRRDGFEKL